MSLHKSYVAEETTRLKPTYLSHNTQQQQQLTEVPVASGITQKISRSTKHQLAGEHLSAASRNKLMAPSPALATMALDKESARTDTRRGNVKDDPPTLSRSASSPFTTRQDSFASSRLPHKVTGPLASSRLPIPSSSASDNLLGLDSTRKALRRKAPSVEQYVSSLAGPELYTKRRTDLKGDRVEKRSSKSLPGNFRESNTTAFLGGGPSDPILPTMLSKRRSGELPPALIPELKALAAATASNRTATSTSHMPSVGSPSTQHSGSTGPWSSRDTTPTSISSCSPGIVQPSRAKTTSRLRKAPTPQAKAEGLRYGFKTPPPIDETASSSRAPYASNSHDDKHSLLHQYRNKQASRPPVPSAPTPPTTKPSVNAKSSQRVEKASGRTPEIEASEHKMEPVRMGEPLEAPPPNAATPSEALRLRDVPPRPSRKGTADLDRRPSPVVQSNLSPQSIRGYRQRDSIDVATMDYPPREMIPARDKDIDFQRQPSSHVAHMRRPSLREHIDPASKSSRLPVNRRERDPEPTARIVAPKESSKQGSREAGRSTMDKISSRLGIFGRRSKLNREDKIVQENRDLRKGPAAGTGHEGYGKYARRGRKQSAGSGNSSRDRSTSTTSRPSLRRKNSRSSTSGSVIDDFVAQRLHPIVIPGGGHIVRPDSDAPTVWPSFDSVSFGSNSSLDLARQLTSEQSPSLASYSRSMSVTSVATDAPSILALDTRARTFSTGIPNQNYPAHAPPSFDGYNTSQSSLMRDDVSVISADQTLSRPTMRDLKKASKTGRIFKWNVFRRKPSAEQSASNVPGRDAENMRMSVAVAPTSFDKPIPYYALMDSENENMVDDDLQDLLEETRQSPSWVAEPDPEPQGLGLRREYGQSVLLPSMPTLQQDSRRAQPSFSPDIEGYEVQLPTEHLGSNPTQSSDNNRRRLPQVGRIPRVISRRDRQHKPAATSFSRPFQRDNAIDASKSSDDCAPTVITENKRPILGIQTDVLPSRPFFTPESGQAASAPAGPPNTHALGDFESHPGFLVFPGKDNPSNPAASRSERDLSVARAPSRTAHRHRTEEDEIWNEYDDFLDQVMSPTSPNPAQPSSGPSSSQLFADAIQPQREHARPESHLRLGALHRKIGYNAYSYETPSLHFPPSPLQEGDSDYRLRRSRIVSALQSHSSMSPSSPFFSSDRTMGHADQGRGSKDYGPAFGGRNVIQPDLVSPSAHTPYLAFPKLPEVSHHQSTALLDIAERDYEGPVGQSDLRFAALMTSRWLSFGRVLFSPAHDLVKANAGQQILVIDGLGNDDWSFYCAVTYPGAVVHGLKETEISPGSQGQRPTVPWRTPPNYRRVEIPNLAERFPFPRSYFAAIVFRFPAAMSDAVLKTALSECKRVLVPGGHLELSLMDLDITNMGTVTRHAVRNLKARMIGSDSNVSLKPVGDNIQNILGQRGFENLNRCVVGVPVAGKVASSSGSRSSRSSRESTSRRSREADRSSNLFESGSYRNNESDRSQQRGGNFSLSELVSDHSATSDAKITKMVAKVGRWWYTRTYEWAVLPGGELKRSIWSDKKMLHECKVRGSSFKLLIAYAQKPVEMRRRTLSEPVRTTAAVAGTRMMERLEKNMG
jgi:hypothetical protein